MTTPETKVKHRTKIWLNDNCSWWSAISDRYHHGIPDFIGCNHFGRLVVVECKSSTGELTPKQRETLSHVALANGIAMVARLVGNKVMMQRMDMIGGKLTLICEHEV